jgi:hypothetical protein
MEYNEEVTRGRLDYASDGKVGCPVCKLNEFDLESSLPLGYTQL